MVDDGERSGRKGHPVVGGIARVLLATTGLALSVPLAATLAYGQTAPAAQAKQSYNIPSQSLDGALAAYSRIAGVQVLNRGAVTQGVTSPGVRGSFTPQEALSRLLAGTSLTPRFVAANTVTVTGRSISTAGATVPGAINLDTINVQGDQQSPYGPGVGYVATRSVSGTKSDTPIIETPQSISVVTRQQLDDQQPQNINQALRYTPGVVAESYGVTSDVNQSISLILRGFTPDSYLDGLKDLSSGNSLIDPYLLDRVEVLSGPASVLYGQASPGGVVNITSKMPTATPLHEVWLGGGNYNHIQGGFDFGGPVDQAGTLLYRVTGTGFSQDTQTDYVTRQTVAIAPAFTWRPDGDTSLTVFAKYINDPTLGAVSGVPAQGTVLPNPNGRIPTSFYPGDPNLYHNSQLYESIGYRFEHRFDDTWTVRQNFRYSHNDSTNNYIAASNLESDLATLDRYAEYGRFVSDSLLVDTQAQAKFATGPVTHTALFGLDYQRYSSSDWFDGDFSGDIPSINVFAPVYYQPIPAPNPGDFMGGSEVQNQVGAYAQDQISLGKWRFLIGGREDWADTNGTFYSGGSSTPITQQDHAFTWRTGLVYLFDNGVAPYASYSTSFQPQSGTTFSGSPYVPTTGQQYEAGIKYQPPGSNSFVTAAAYNLTEQNVLTPDPDPTHSGFEVQTGEIRVRGIELQGHAEITDNFKAIATYTFLNPVNTKSNTTDVTINGLTESTLGKQPVAIPTQMASLWGDYTFHGGALSGFGVGGGVRYVGSSYGDDVNSFKVPAVTLFDAAVHYDLGEATPMLKGAKFQLNVSNLFDKSYVAACTNSFAGCSFGLRRTIYATLKYSW